MDCYIGVDLGGTNIRAAVVDEKGIIYGRAAAKTNRPYTPEGISESVITLSKQAALLSRLSMSDIISIGVGAPGSVNRDTGIIEFSDNLGFKFVPLAALIEKGLGKKVFIENDANAAAFGEYIAGAGRGAKNMVAVTLGTGIGGGIIVDGRLYTGSNYAAGELGHFVMVYGGEKCNCGRYGCFERYASATALIRQTKRKMAGDQSRSSALWQAAGGSIDNVDGSTAFIAEKMGDALAHEVVETYTGYLASGLISIINIFQPEILCIGGGISAEGERLLIPVQKAADTEEYARDSLNRCRIVIAQLGNDAGLIGAALLPHYCGKY